MPSCCAAPYPVGFRIAPEGRFWVVMSTCDNCGAARRESPYYDLHVHAQNAMWAQKARLGRVSGPHAR